MTEEQKQLKEVINAVKKRRTELGLSLNKLQVETGVSSIYLGKFERGLLEGINLKTLNKICGPLGIRIEPFTVSIKK